MKPEFYLFRVAFRIAAMLLAASLASACGQRGPLYLPKPVEATPAPAKQAPSNPGNVNPASK